MPAAIGMKIWIDLENSPHVPFFMPIMKELKARGYEIVLTARDCAQTCGLADLYHLQYTRIGRHYGKSKVLKTIGLLMRVSQMVPLIAREKPVLAVSHGSRTQLMASKILGVPSILTMDYEHTQKVPFSTPDWLIVPEVISDIHRMAGHTRVLTYPGIKEDVYVPSFTPGPSFREEFGIGADELVATIRPPATDAHYFVPQSEELFEATLEFLLHRDGVRLIVLPRNEKQGAFLRKTWAPWFDRAKIVIPPRVVDGLNLLWHSDLVISGGGTMNREAAALGVPVYSIFRGTIGAVDRYLADTGRLVLLESAGDVRTKIPLVPRRRPDRPEHLNRAALTSLVNSIISIAESSREKRTSAAKQGRTGAENIR